MNDSEDQIQRAIKRISVEDQSRYAEEWRRDLAEAKASSALAEADVGPGALRMAAHLRGRWFGTLLLGGVGPVWAVVGWAALALWALAGFFMGNIVVFLGLITFIIVVLALSKAGVHTTLSYVAMVASVIVGTIAAAFVWWILGVKLDAADAMTPEPEIAHWGGTALILTGVSALVFIASVVFAAARHRKIRALR
ncbi:MAG: hypothetical protein ACRCSP_08315 [Rhodoglobus sp.]